MRIAAAQAADELLSILGVKASFVLYRSGNDVGVSARSLGDVNVQVILEEFGGGGHFTMAPAPRLRTSAWRTSAGPCCGSWTTRWKRPQTKIKRCVIFIRARGTPRRRAEKGRELP